MASEHLHEPDPLFNPALPLGIQPAPSDTPLGEYAETDMDSTNENIQWIQTVSSYKAAGMTNDEISEFLSLFVKVAEAGMALDDIKAFEGIV